MHVPSLQHTKERNTPMQEGAPCIKGRWRVICHAAHCTGGPPPPNPFPLHPSHPSTFPSWSSSIQQGCANPHPVVPPARLSKGLQEINYLTQQQQSWGPHSCPAYGADTGIYPVQQPLVHLPGNGEAIKAFPLTLTKVRWCCTGGDGGIVRYQTMIVIVSEDSYYAQ